MRIYFGIGGQYGDVMMGEPSLRRLIKMNPDAEFVIGTSHKYGDILPLFYDYHPQVIDYKIWDAYRVRPEEFSDADRGYVDKMKFDKMYSDVKLHTSPTWMFERHQVEEMGLMLGVEVDSLDICLKRPDVVPKNKTVSISLFPNNKNKKCIKAIGLGRIQEIVLFICSLGYEVIHLNGPEEPDIEGATKINVPYNDAVKEMLSTDLLIAGDTGMAWVASAYNHPVVGLYAVGYWGKSSGCTTSKNWQAINNKAIYLESWAAKDIPLNDIYNAINKKLEV